MWRMDAADIAAGRERWQQRYDAARTRDADFTTLSGIAGRPGLRAADGAAYPGFERIGWPGEYPYTRGLYPTGYRGRTWTIRQFAGLRQRAADQRALQDDPRPPAAAGCASRSTCRR